jgi:hypothetical protein
MEEHCKEEFEQLKLLRELSHILSNGLDSLANKIPPTVESRYVGDAAISVNIASDGYIFLRVRLNHRFIDWA